MALSSAGEALTAAHRTAQLRVQALALGRFARLWPLWTGDDSSFEQLVELAVPLVRVHYQLSSSLASTYYGAFRRAEGATGEATPRLAPALTVDRVKTSLWVTGRVMTAKALAQGVEPEAAMRTALVRTSGSVGRHVVTGARATLIQSTAADRQAHGYARVTHAKACDFCRMLATRGAVYSDSTADFRAHDHCACMAEPRYRG
jgi:hypothetical protein